MTNGSRFGWLSSCFQKCPSRWQVVLYGHIICVMCRWPIVWYPTGASQWWSLTPIRVPFKNFMLARRAKPPTANIKTKRVAHREGGKLYSIAYIYIYAHAHSFPPIYSLKFNVKQQQQWRRNVGFGWQWCLRVSSLCHVLGKCYIYPWSKRQSI